MHQLNIKKPTLIIDTDRVKRNIERAILICNKLGMEFRPHFKTHRSETIGNMFQQLGVNKITVSSVTMARYFALCGFLDITIAFPANPLEINEIDSLAGEINLNLIFDSIESLTFFAKNMQNKVGAFIEIDDGYHRTGVAAENFEGIINLAKLISRSKTMEFRGILAHSGNTYISGSPIEIKRSFAVSMFKLLKIKEMLLKNFDNCMLSIGDTPSFILGDGFNGADEARPGVFVYFDAMMESFGVCTFGDVALTLAAPVIGKYPDRNEIALYAGAVHLSKDALKDNKGKSIYGYLSNYKPNWILEMPEKNNFLRMLSQEHGIAQVTPEFFNSVSIGDIVAVVPVHACLTADAANRGIDKSGADIKMMYEK